jgi:dephospho-CoA kinase
MVARRLVECGAVLVDADQLAREVVAPGTEGLREVVAAFGEELLGADGALDRAALGARVFGDAAARRRLEGIVHPRVRARTRELTDAAPPGAIVVNDVPLLVEAGLPTSYHIVLVVEAAEAIRVARLRDYRGMSLEQAQARIRAQATDEQRRAAADVLLANESTVEELWARVDRVWRQRLVPFEENVRLRRPVVPAEPLAIRPYDPTWPTQYARLAVRIADAAGGRRVDHVGATAVPGMAARDLIDIQLTVDRLADADRIAEALDEAGFPRVDGDWRDTQRLHVAADPGRLVQVHARAAGSPGWRAALLIRDWLRADPEARREFAAEVPRFDEVWARAQGWARSTGWQPS